MKTQLRFIPMISIMCLNLGCVGKFYDTTTQKQKSTDIQSNNNRITQAEPNLTSTVTQQKFHQNEELVILDISDVISKANSMDNIDNVLNTLLPSKDVRVSLKNVKPLELLSKEDITILCKILPKLPKLEQLLFDGIIFNDIIIGNGVEFKNLLTAISKLNSLKALHLRQARIHNATYIKLAIKSISGLSEIEDLDLSGNQLEKDGIEELGKIKSLKSLKINGREYNKIISKEDFPSFIQSLKNLTQLEVLEISSVIEDPSEVNELANVLPQLIKLKSLSISANYANDDSVDSIIELIKKLPGLEILNLNDAKIGDEGVKKIVKVLPQFTKLKSLNLSNNSILDSAAVLSNALPSLKNLEILDLSRNNSMRNNWVSAIAGSLPRLSNLKKLNLGDSSLTKDGIIDLIKSMPNSVEEFYFPDHVLNEGDKEEINELLSKHPKLKERLIDIK